MDNNHEEQLSPELKEKLLEVELAAEAEERNNTLASFDSGKAILIGALCAGVGISLGVILGAGLFNAVMFSLLMGGIGFVTGGYQRARKK